VARDVPEQQTDCGLMAVELLWQERFRWLSKLQNTIFCFHRHHNAQSMQDFLRACKLRELMVLVLLKHPLGTPCTCCKNVLVNQSRF
jgi:hypothetical protein